MPLEGKTAVVTGAARGIGRGIGLVLGEAGVTVYLTDRETRRRKRSPLPGTVEDTAEQGGLTCSLPTHSAATRTPSRCTSTTTWRCTRPAGLPSGWRRTCARTA
jgi:NAD(P)-dependent dehydrogenase (short-subunit alcohol dehydrogenase family)